MCLFMAIMRYKLIEIEETVELDLAVSKGRRWDFVIESHQFVRGVKLNSQTLVVMEVVVFQKVFLSLRDSVPQIFVYNQCYPPREDL